MKQNNITDTTLSKELTFSKYTSQHILRKKVEKNNFIMYLNISNFIFFILDKETKVKNLKNKDLCTTKTKKINKRLHVLRINSSF